MRTPIKQYELSSCQEIAKKFLFIIADVIPADVIESVAKPNNNKIIEAGAYKRAFVGGIKGTYCHTPTSKQHYLHANFPTIPFYRNC